jgi:NAD+ kinase
MTPIDESVASARMILLVAHTGRRDSLEAISTACRQLTAAGVTPVLSHEDTREIVAFNRSLGTVPVLGVDAAIEQLELVIVLGGDGTILRAAEIVRGAAVPVLGVNVGHMGFLAESERDDLADTITKALSRNYTVEARMALSVSVAVGGQPFLDDWALNDVSVEKASRGRMVEVVIEVDGRPASSFGCDGVVMSTPTGSTAYSFSAGGPIVWPTLEALLMVPLNAHALFARPLVVGADSVLAVELLDRTPSPAVLWCDGRRTHDLPQGARIEVRRSEVPVYLARLTHGPFTDRLVRKFALPVDGWRGPVGRD